MGTSKWALLCAGFWVTTACGSTKPPSKPAETTPPPAPKASTASPAQSAQEQQEPPPAQPPAPSQAPATPQANPPFDWARWARSSDLPIPTPPVAVQCEGLDTSARPVSWRPNNGFAVRDGEELMLDLAAPKHQEPKAWVLLLHGGGWRAGERAHLHREAVTLASMGYAAATADYRLAPDHPYPAALEDTHCATLLMRDLRFSIDHNMSSPLVLIGFSAGAHLAAMVAATDYRGNVLCGRRSGPDSPDTGTHVPSGWEVSGWVGYYGPYVLSPITRWHRANQRMISKFLGGTTADLESLEGLAQQATPTFHVRTEPTVGRALLVHGSKDVSVPPAESHAMAKAIREKGGIANVLELPELPHGFRLFSPLPGASVGACETLKFIQSLATP